MRTKTEPTFTLNHEQLLTLQDDQLVSFVRELQIERTKAYKMGQDPTLIEIEICYLKNELQKRDIRRIEHSKYLSENEEENSNVDEDDYPVADLDNSQFIFL